MAWGTELPGGTRTRPSGVQQAQSWEFHRGRSGPHPRPQGSRCALPTVHRAAPCAPGHGSSPEDTCERSPCHGATSTLGHRLPAPPRQPRSNGAGEASAAPPGMDRCYQAPPHRCPLGPKRLDVGFPSGIKAKRFCCRYRRKRLPNLPTAEQGGLGEKARNKLSEWSCRRTPHSGPERGRRAQTLPRPHPGRRTAPSSAGK